jgi:hypothetical protein
MPCYETALPLSTVALSLSECDVDDEILVLEQNENEFLEVEQSLLRQRHKTSTKRLSSDANYYRYDATLTFVCTLLS